MYKSRRNSNRKKNKYNLKSKKFYYKKNRYKIHQRTKKSKSRKNISKKLLKHILLCSILPLIATQNIGNSQQEKLCKELELTLLNNEKLYSIAPLVIIPKNSQSNPTNKDIHCMYNFLERDITYEELFGVATLFSIPVLTASSIIAIICLCCIYKCNQRKKKKPKKKIKKSIKTNSDSSLQTSSLTSTDIDTNILLSESDY